MVGVRDRKRVGLLLPIVLAMPLSARSQVAPAAHDLPPAAGEIREGRYFNYFFGLKYAWPETWSPNLAFRVADKGTRPTLLFVSSRPNALEQSVLALSADALDGMPAKKYLQRKQHDDRLSKFKRLEVTGQEFFRAEADNVFAPYRVVLVCFRKQYAIVFTLSTTERDVATNAERLVEKTEFSDLAVPDEFAQRLRESRALRNAADHGVISGQVYGNSVIGFSFTFPQGWRVMERGEMQEASKIGREAAAGKGRRPPVEHGLPMRTTQYLFGAADAQASGRGNPSRVVVMGEDLLGMPEIQTPLDMLAALNLVFGSAGQHSRQARIGNIGGQEFAAQRIVVSGRDDTGSFASDYVGDFATVLGRTALIFLFISPTQQGLYGASRAMNTFHLSVGTGASSPPEARPR
jgi:hypothetical protein